MNLRILLVVITLLFSQLSFAEDLGRARPEKMGMSSQRLERLDGLNRKYVEDGKLAGVMTMVARHGRIVHLNAAGTYGIDNDKPVAADTLFRIYSMSKPITAVALMTLYEEGAFQLSAPVSKFLPQFADMKVWKQDGNVDAEGQITMHQLLTHTSGLTYGFHRNTPVDQRYQDDKILGSKDLSEFVDKLAKIPLLFEPGERWHYSVAPDVLGAVAEKISGQTYDVFLKERLFDPLGMEDTFFNVPADKLDRFPSNHYWDAKVKALKAIPKDSPFNQSYSDQTLFSGGGGLVSSIIDYMKFAEMLRSGGTFNGARILSPKTIQYMTRNHLAATVNATGSGESPGMKLSAERTWQGTGFGLGFGVVTNPAQAGVVSSVGEYSWGGAAGTIFWIDPEEDLVAIGMLQLMGSPWPFRSEMKVLTYQAINELNNK
jgi:CubicO group peptidase (beta-lactamase class C family)